MNTENINTRISVIIPTYKRGDIFYQCITSVIDSISEQDEIIVVNDDKSAKISIDSVDLKGKKVTVLDNPKQGVASARNYGAAHSKGEVLLFVDDDMIINSNALEDSYLLLKQNSNVVINPNWIYPSTLNDSLKNNSFGRFLLSIQYNSLKGWAQSLDWNDEAVFELPMVASYFLMIQKYDFEKLKGYNELFPLAGAEDFDFGTRIKQYGLKTLCNPKSIVLHNEKDRVDIQSWMQRKFNAAQTRRIAAQLGYQDMAMHYNFIDKVMANRIYSLRNVFFFLLTLVPNRKWADPFYFKIVKGLLFSYLVKGYYNTTNEKNN